MATKKAAAKSAPAKSASKPAAKAPAKAAAPKADPAPMAAPAASASSGGFFAIPVVQRSPTGILALVLCILASGIGTIVVGIMEKKTNVWVLGIIQLVLWPIGHLWAIIWGILVFVRSTA